MHRNITLDAVAYAADIGSLNNYRVTVRDSEVFVSSDLSARTLNAEFEANFYGKERIEIITAPKPETQEIITAAPNPAYIDPETTPDIPETVQETQVIAGPERYEIGPLELDADETPLVLAKRAKLAEIAAARWATEVGGIMVDGTRVDTSRESRALLTSAEMAAANDSTYTCQWKAASGFVTLDAAAVLAMAQAVRAHVQACFDQEAELAAQVATAETVEAVEEITW
jgi:hypothetical protein